MSYQRMDLNQTFLEMRGRCLSLAADLDRLDRANIPADARMKMIRESLQILLDGQGNRAERVQLLFSDPVKA